MGWEIVSGVYAVAVLFIVFGALFIRHVSGGAASVKSLIVQPFRILLAPLYMIRVLAVFVFIAVGIAFLLNAPYYITYYYTTGYNYVLMVQKSPLTHLDYVCHTDVNRNLICGFIQRLTLDRAVTNVELLEYPVKTAQTIMVLRSDYVLFGLAFIIIGTILTAYFLAKSNTAAAKAAGTWVERPE